MALLNKIIKDFDNYIVYSDGTIVSPTGVMSQQDCGMGYKKVILTNEKGYKNLRIHRLVAQAFLPNFSLNLQVNHIDGNKHNNHLNNLEMVTGKQNIAHAAATGKHNKGSKPLLTKLEVEEIKKLLIMGFSTAGIALKFNRSQRCIQYIKKGQRGCNYKKVC